MEEGKSKRFGSVTEQQLQQIVDGSTPENTKRTTRFWLSVFKRYCDEKKIALDLSSCTSAELSNVLKFFYVEVRNSDGKTYQRSSLASVRAAIQRRLKDLRRPINVYKDKEFEFANSIFQANIKDLHQRGQLQATQHKPALREEDLGRVVEYLYSNTDDPINLAYGAWFSSRCISDCEDAKSSAACSEPISNSPQTPRVCAASSFQQHSQQRITNRVPTKCRQVELRILTKLLSHKSFSTR